MAEKTIAGLIKQDPSLQQKLDESLGYAVANMKVTKVPIVGAGTAAAEGSSGALNEGYTVHVLSDGGASATATARIIRIKVNSELTVDP